MKCTSEHWEKLQSIAVQEMSIILTQILSTSLLMLYVRDWLLYMPYTVKYVLRFIC